jgi:PAS domain S-box-containing protein
MDAQLVCRGVTTEWPLCEVVHVNGREPFEQALKEQSFDVILADYSLPGISGLNALEMARILCPDTPFLFVSGAIGDEVAVESLKAGATDYVLKDRLARLVPAIRRALNEAAQLKLSKKVAEQLGQSEQQYRHLVNSIDGIVWQADFPSLRFTFVSQQAERLLGYPVSAWLDQDDFWQQHIHTEDRQRATDLFSELNRENMYLNFEYRMLASDGRVIWFRDIITLLAEPGQPKQVRGIMVNITPRKQAESARLESEAKLEQTNRDLMRRNQEIQSFYHTLSHELKTPLTSAREFISILMEGLAGPVTETQQEYLGVALDSCNQLRVCINDLLDATRLETGKLTLQLQPASLTGLIQRILTAMGPRAAEKKLALIDELQPELPPVPMDETRITQVVTNLLNNAIKHTRPGGTIIVRAGQSTDRPQLVEVSVTDTGCGIPPEECERIFDRLYQIKAGDASNEQGVGLGLYLCRELVQLHGGGIQVESEVGRGSTFSFFLPMDRRWLQTSLLVIDDDPLILDMVRELLGAEHFHVRTARDGEEGLAEIRRQVPDIILLDLAMPNMDGAATLKAIRENWGPLPVILHTGFANSEIVKEAVLFSPFTLLAKPSTAAQIIETVRKVQRSGDTTTWQKNHFGLQRPRHF